MIVYICKQVQSLVYRIKNKLKTSSNKDHKLMSLLLLRDTSIILGINLFGQIQKIVFELRRVVKYFIKLLFRIILI